MSSAVTAPDSPVDEADTLVDRVEELLQEFRSSTSYRVDLLSTLILTLAALGTAFAGYQASLWSGIEAEARTEAAVLRAEANQQLLRGGQLALVDLAVFVEWLNAARDENFQVTAFVAGNMRDEMRTAFEAWIATDPQNNPDAPRSPFEMPEYSIGPTEVSRQLQADAAALSEAARAANDTSDSYVGATVVLATALFFGGMVSKLRERGLQVTMLVLGGGMLIYGVIRMISLPSA